MDVIGKPRRNPGQEYAAIFEHRSLRVQAHNFIGAGRGFVFGDAIYEFGFQVLDELRAGCLVLDQDGSGVIFLGLLDHSALEVGIVQFSPDHVDKIIVLKVDAPCGANAVVAEIGRLVGCIPTLNNSAEWVVSQFEFWRP